MTKTRLARRFLLLGALGGALLASCAPPLVPQGPLESEPRDPTVEYVGLQEILVPLPLRVRLPSRYGAERVLVFYRTWGSPGWEALELARQGQTWSGAVSCRDVSTVTGDTRYFFMALNAAGEEVVGSGWPEWPHVATIVRSLPEGPQTLPGMGAAKCHDPADCPPDFLGCPAYALVRPPCHTSSDCRDGARCAWDGYCNVAPGYAWRFDEEATDEELLDAAVRRVTHRDRRVAANGMASYARGPVSGP
jgi:hypothetical protein